MHRSFTEVNFAPILGFLASKDLDAWTVLVAPTLSPDNRPSSNIYPEEDMATSKVFLFNL